MIDKSKFNTDKSPIYLEIYDKFFKDLKEKEIKLLELGIFGGGSMLLWEDYFKKGKIVGVDIEKIEIPQKTERVKLYQGNQKDITFLENLCSENAPNGFDIIIDDASHFGQETFVSFIYLFKNHLKSGGIYAIED